MYVFALSTESIVHISYRCEPPKYQRGGFDLLHIANLANSKQISCSADVCRALLTVQTFSAIVWACPLAIQRLPYTSGFAN